MQDQMKVHDSEKKASIFVRFWSILLRQCIFFYVKCSQIWRVNGFLIVHDYYFTFVLPTCFFNYYFIFSGNFWDSINNVNKYVVHQNAFIMLQMISYLLSTMLDHLYESLSDKVCVNRTGWQTLPSASWYLSWQEVW